MKFSWLYVNPGLPFRCERECETVGPCTAGSFVDSAARGQRSRCELAGPSSGEHCRLRESHSAGTDVRDSARVEASDQCLAQPSRFGLTDRPGAAAIDEPGRRASAGSRVSPGGRCSQVEHALRLGRG